MVNETPLRRGFSVSPLFSSLFSGSVDVPDRRVLCTSCPHRSILRLNRAPALIHCGRLLPVEYAGYRATACRPAREAPAGRLCPALGPWPCARAAICKAWSEQASALTHWGDRGGRLSRNRPAGRPASTRACRGDCPSRLTSAASGVPEKAICSGCNSRLSSAWRWVSSRAVMASIKRGPSFRRTFEPLMTTINPVDFSRYQSQRTVKPGLRVDRGPYAHCSNHVSSRQCRTCCASGGRVYGLLVSGTQWRAHQWSVHDASGGTSANEYLGRVAYRRLIRRFVSAFPRAWGR